MRPYTVRKEGSVWDYMRDAQIALYTGYSGKWIWYMNGAITHLKENGLVNETTWKNVRERFELSKMDANVILANGDGTFTRYSDGSPMETFSLRQLLAETYVFFMEDELFIRANPTGDARGFIEVLKGERMTGSELTAVMAQFQNQRKPAH